ncbi:MAG: recombinase family protein [Thermoplasmatales archaeon]|nr:MAG: recombinase family protein [Thermoplasmatales archaeon]
MRQNNFPKLIKNLALKRADYRCERCWSKRDLEFHHISPLKLGGKSTVDNCIVLCHNCHNITPKDRFLLKNYFLKFASTKEMINYYNVEDEYEAIKELSKELSIDYKKLRNKIEISQPSHIYAVKQGMKHSVEKRGHAGFNIPYGYEYRNGELKIKPKEAKIVNDIYQWYLSGVSMGKIVKMLNSAQISTKKGCFWAKKTISAILKNLLYCGYFRHEEKITKSNHEQIIDLATFRKVQKIIESQGGKPSNF